MKSGEALSHKDEVKVEISEEGKTKLDEQEELLLAFHTLILLMEKLLEDVDYHHLYTRASGFTTLLPRGLWIYDEEAERLSEPEVVNDSSRKHVFQIQQSGCAFKLTKILVTFTRPL